MVEIQCSSCQTRYRIDEGVLPDETPTFKCSRCGHVFTAEPRRTDVAPEPPPPRRPRARVRALPSRLAPPADPAPSDEPADEPDAAKNVSASDSAPLPQAADSAPADTSERTFRDHEAKADTLGSGNTGDNLRFDFADEDAHHADNPELSREADEGEGWEVGENVLNFATEKRPHDGEARPAEPAEMVAAVLRGDEQDLDITAMDRGRAVHSAGFFMVLFFFVALGFGAMTLVISGQPTASASLMARLPAIGERFAAPASPAILVALRDVKTDYQKINGERTALIIAGNAQNVGNQPLHTVGIAASLLDGSQREITRQAVYCGNNLSDRMISEMTPREIEFFQKLGPPKTFTLEPSASSPFVIVFVDPPAQTARLAISIAQAEPAAPAATSAPGAAPPTSP